MSIFRTIFSAAALALALAAASADSASAQASVQGQAGIAAWRGSRNEQLIDNAVRRYGYRPNRLSHRQVAAIHRAWDELLGPGASRRRTGLNRTQATAIVYMALVQPYEDERGYDRPRDRDDDDRYGRDGRRDDRDGRYERPTYWSAQCDELQADAYRLGSLISAPGGNVGLFVAEPERARARALAQQIQQRAVQCRATGAANHAAEVLELLSAALPDRNAIRLQVDALKHELQQAQPGRGR